MDLQNALDAYKPELAAYFIKYVSNTFERLVAHYGPGLRGVHNSSSARLYRNTIDRFVVNVDPNNHRPNADQMICAERLAKGAVAYADAVVATWKTKIEGKMGLITDAKVRRMGASGTSFIIEGKRGSDMVEIVQNMILNFSGLGTPYNQFPALIYVNGKRVSEKSYKAA